MYRAKRETISYSAIQIITMRKEQRPPTLQKKLRRADIKRESSGVNSSNMILHIQSLYHQQT